MQWSEKGVEGGGKEQVKVRGRGRGSYRGRRGAQGLDRVAVESRGTREEGRKKERVRKSRELEGKKWWL